MKYDPYSTQYPSRRTVTYAAQGMVCTSVPLAAQAGLNILRRGGNAFDAAIATAACMPVVEPCSNGIGGDAFALIWSKGKLYGLNSSGRAPMGISLEKMLAKGYTDELPSHGWEPVMVPGAPGAWSEISRRFGRLPLTEVLEPAAQYAENGYPVSPTVARAWGRAFDVYTKLEGPEFAPWRETFAPNGHAPVAGEIWKCADMAHTLREIARTGAESFYRGSLMEKIVAFSRETGGYFCEEDFTTWHPEWVEPITTYYKGYDVYEIPPNGHGITVLMALNILKGLELPEDRDSVETYHKMIEALKLAFTDAKTYVSDPSTMQTRVADLLSEEYAARRRALISEKAIDPQPGDPRCGGTVYLCAADGEGNMISYIQSNYKGFGSGVVVPGTGISLQDRGCGFSLDPKSDNCLGPGKKAYHTIIPGFLCKDGQPVGPFGVMGGFMQPQGHLQVLVNAIDYGMNPQECLDAPRFQWTSGKKIQLEACASPELVEGLRARGHEVEVVKDSGGMGRGQIIWRTEYGTLAGGTEPRCDGHIAVY